tara:strand:+ start:882 stop:1640 length:759 start_codon:yes stop_codon:yes gene_type:complete
MRHLRPFWRYYGGKNRAAPIYPQPEHDTIIEPFAGAAGYSCRYPDRKVILIDKSPIIAGIWRYLIATPAAEILALPDIPEGGTVDDLPASVCQEARWLAGFWLNDGTTSPGKSWSKRALQKDGRMRGWTRKTRAHIAAQVDRIRHWEVIEGDYHDAPDVDATWHVDPPYKNKAGSHYPHQPESFAALGEWCKTRRGLVMVCENDGADWLPFERIAEWESSAVGKRSSEVIWLNRRPKFWQGVQTGLFDRAVS